MTLKEKIQENLKKALKEKKEVEVLTLRMLLAAVFNKEKEKRYVLSQEKSEISIEKLKKESPEYKELERESFLDDKEMIDVIFSEVKKRKESILAFQKGKREDLVEKEKKELEVLKRYLPEQLPEEEIKKLVQETIKEVAAQEIKDMGKVMKELMPKIKGRADGNLVSKIVKDLLEK